MNVQPANKASRWMQIQAILKDTASSPSGIALLLIGAAGLLVGIATLVVAGIYFYNLRQPQATASPEVQTPAGQINLPTQACPAAVLKLGEQAFAVEETNLTPEGRLPEIQDSADTAYRMAGTGERRVFLLGPAAFEQDPAALQSLAQAIYADETCRTILYQLEPPQAVVLSSADLIELLQSDLTVFVQTSPDKSGVLLQGTAVEEQINPAGAPTPTEGSLEVGIDIQSVQTSQVGRLMQVKVSIYNFGAAPVELTGDNLALLVPGGNSLGPTGSKPALPRTIQPGQTVGFEMIFPLPAEGLGRLRIFKSEFELSEYAK